MNALFLSAMKAVKTALNENKEFLTQLDGAIGDADHGINMSRGFDAVVAKLEADPEDDPAALLKKVGMTLLSTVGGTSGPLYGTAFMRAAIPAQGKADIDQELAAQMLLSAIGGIKERGKAVRGEKTMIDALEPAYDAFEQGVKNGESFLKCLELACSAAENGVEYTKTIIAKKGRASYLGERSIGHQDPGATSSTIMLKTLMEFYRTNVRG